MRNGHACVRSIHECFSLCGACTLVFEKKYLASVAHLHACHQWIWITDDQTKEEAFLGVLRALIGCLFAWELYGDL